MSLSEQTVGTVMSDEVIGIEASRTVGEALLIAAEHRINHFPVFESYSLVGFVCTCDLRDAPVDSLVAERMHTDIIEVAPDATTLEAARTMNCCGVGSLLVRDAYGIRGIVTRGDLIERASDSRCLFTEVECAFCRGQRHLRAGPDGLHVCVDCLERNRPNDWFELAPGD